MIPISESLGVLLIECEKWTWVSGAEAMIGKLESWRENDSKFLIPKWISWFQYDSTYIPNWSDSKIGILIPKMESIFPNTFGIKPRNWFQYYSKCTWFQNWYPDSKNGINFSQYVWNKAQKLIPVLFEMHLIPKLVSWFQKWNQFFPILLE